MPALLRALALLAVLALANGQGTTGITVQGYTFGSEIKGYLDISQDVCDIAAAADAGDWATAAAIYANGKHSARGDGTLRALKAWATAGEADEPHWGVYVDHFGNSTTSAGTPTSWLDAFITAGLEGVRPWTAAAARKQVIKKGVSSLLTSYMWHEVDEVTEDVAADKTDAAEGAPHAVDEAAAIYFGTSCAAGSLADVATKRATTFGTMVPGADGACVAPTNVAAAAALKGLQEAAKAGDSAAYATAAAALDKVIVTIFAQATLTYAAELQEIVEKGAAVQGALPDTAEASAEGVAFFRAIEPLVAAVAPADAAAVADLLATPVEGMQAQVAAALQPTLDAYGITTDELGSLGATNACEPDAPYEG